MRDFRSDPFSGQDEYHTPDRSVRIGPILREFIFYPRVLWEIIRSGLRAKRGAYSGAEWAASSLRVMRYLEGVGGRIHVEGMHHIISEPGPVVFIGNHMSTLETMVMPCLVQPKKNTTFVVKSELLEYPFFKHVLGSRNPVLVGRENPREDLKAVFLRGEALLSDGVSIILFPQRTRSTRLDPEGFNTLGVKLAQRNNVKVIPVALVTDAWSNGKYIRELGKLRTEKMIYFAFGTPLSPEQSSDDTHQAVLEFIMNKLRVWDRLDCLP